MKIFLGSFLTFFLIFLFLYHYHLRLKSVEAWLRLFAVIIILLVLFNFKPTLSFTSRDDRAVYILIDDSKSMATKEKSEQLHKILSAIRSISSRLYTFSEDLRKLEGDEKMSAEGHHTDIARAIEKINLSQPAGVILVSDGNHNYGQDPLEICRIVKFPINTVGIGNESVSDVEVLGVESPVYAFYGEKFKVKIRIKYFGYNNEEARIRLLAEGKAMATQTFKLKNSALNDFEFEVTAKALGRNLFEALVNTDAEDDNPLNNKYQFYVEVLKDKIDLLYYTSNLSQNLSFLSKMLKQENYFNPTYCAALTHGGYYEIDGDAIKRTHLPEVNQFDIVILDDVGFEGFPQKELLQGYIEKGGSLLFLAGPHTSDWKAFLDKTIALSLDGRSVGQPVEIKTLSPFSLFTSGLELPPFDGLEVASVKDKKTLVIAETKEHLPLIGYGKYKQGRIFFILGFPIWQWGFRLVGLDRDNPLPRLMTDIVRFLSPVGIRRHIELKTRKIVFNLSEAVELTAQTYNENLIPQGDYEVFIRIGGDSAYADLPMIESGIGHYRANFVASKAGKFRVQAYAIMNGSEQQSNELSFEVQNFLVEDWDKGLNKDLLVGIAQTTHGQYIGADQLANFKPELKPVEKVVRVALDFNQPIFFIVFCLLLIIEWFLRKRKGEI